MGDLEEAPVSWFRVSLAPAIGAAWGVNQWTEDFPLCLFTSLHISLCNKKKITKMEEHIGDLSPLR